jgi:hypothetical protein
MLGEFDFHLTQVQYLKAAMDQLPTFAPLAMTPAQVQAVYDGALLVRTEYQNSKAGLDLARGEMYEKTDEAHQVAVGVYGVMKTRYRKDEGSLSAITKLPTQDRSPEETRQRMEAMSSLWGQLPNDPFAVPPGPLVAWPGMNKAAFDAKLATMIAGHNGLVNAYEDFQLAEGALHAKDSELADLAVAALAEGRAQFPAGTPEREVIDSIPIIGGTQRPNQAVISAAVSVEPGRVHLEFDAAHATSFDVLHKGPGGVEFSNVADDVTSKTYDATGLTAGSHEYKVIGQNSRGEGPESTVAIVAVASGGGGGAPAAPGIPMLTILAFGQLQASWLLVVGATAYRIFKKVLGTDLDFIEISTAAAGPVTITTLPPGETVQIRLTALNNAGESAPGPHAEITMPASPP